MVFRITKITLPYSLLLSPNYLNLVKSLVKSIDENYQLIQVLCLFLEVSALLIFIDKNSRLGFYYYIDYKAFPGKCNLNLEEVQKHLGPDSKKFFTNLLFLGKKSKTLWYFDF